MKYESDGADYEAVCEAIGWHAGSRAIEVMANGGEVYVTGTLLKPHEWLSLKSHNGKLLPDGRQIKITKLPSNI